MLVKLYKRLLPFSRPYRGKMILAAIFNILANLVGSVNLLGLLPIVSIVLGEPNSIVPSSGSGKKNLLDKFSDLFIVTHNGAFDAEASLIRICLFVFITYALKNIFQYISGYLMAIVESGMAKNIRDTLFERLSKLSLDYYYDRKSGHLLNKLTSDVDRVNSTLASSTMTIIGQPVQIIGFLTTMLLSSVKLTVVSVGIAFLSIYLVRLFGKTIKSMSHRLQSLQGDIMTVAQEMINGVKVVKSFGMERYEVNRFQSETEKHFHSNRRLARIRNLTSPINESLAVLGFIGILWFGGHEVFDHAMRGSALMYFLMALIALMQPVKVLGDLNSRLFEGAASAENIFAVIDAEPTVVPGTVTAPRVHDKPIVLEDVSFHYSSVTENAVDHLSLELYPNEVLALVGPSGAGKTTLVDLLVRFYDPTEGRILLGGRNIQDYDLESLRSLFGIVTQDTLLFHDTIFNNISYGNRDASTEMVYDAARAANAHDFILQLPDGYNTFAGDRGVRLSGGQRQRIAIARALLKNPPILIFDEATSALDTENEMLVQQAIHNLLKERTAVVIAHRLSTIQQADRIVVMDKGHIAEIGTHAELVTKEGGIYQRLHSLQSRAGWDGDIVLGEQA